MAGNRGRGLGGKRINRQSINLTNELKTKISKLSVACAMTESNLISTILEDALNSENYINRLQEKHNRHPEFRLVPIKSEGKVVL